MILKKDLFYIIIQEVQNLQKETLRLAYSKGYESKNIAKEEYKLKHNYKLRKK